MIQQLKLSANAVFLQGMSLRGSFTITNPNEFLAISYFIEPLYIYQQSDPQSPDTESTSSPMLSIFPKSGLLLKGQTQKITVKAKCHQQFKNESFIEGSTNICVKSTLNNNFNKILLKNQKIEGLSEDQLQSYKSITTVYVEIGTDHIRLKDEIENEVLLGSSLGKQTGNISVIGSKVRQDWQDGQDREEVCTIVSNLQLNSKLKSNINRQESIIFSYNTKQINKAGDPVRQGINGDEKFDMQFYSARDLAFSKSFQDLAAGTAANRKVNSFQLILLAVLAGFFYSLGSNIRQLYG